MNASFDQPWASNGLDVSRNPGMSPCVTACLRHHRADLGIGRGAGETAPSQKAEEAWASSRPSAAGSRSRLQTSDSSFKGARQEGREFRPAKPVTPPRPTVEGAKDAAGAVARIPAARAVSGHEKCQTGAKRRARLPRRRQRDVQGQGLRIRQEPRHDDGRGLPAKVYMSGRSTGPGMHARRPSSPAPSANSLPAATGRCLCRRRGLCFAFSAHEPPRHTARTRGRRPAGDRRPDRRRQVRHHVPVAGAADARHARRRRRRSQRRARHAASSRPPAGRRSAMPRPRSATRSRAARTHVTDDAEALIADPRHRGDRRGDRRSGRRHPSRARGDRARQAHRHGQCRGRRAGGPAAGAQGEGGGRRLSASPGATSRR